MASFLAICKRNQIVNRSPPYFRAGDKALRRDFNCGGHLSLKPKSNQTDRLPERESIHRLLPNACAIRPPAIDPATPGEALPPATWTLPFRSTRRVPVVRGTILPMAMSHVPAYLNPNISWKEIGRWEREYR